MPKRRANGEGNIRKRKDGRWEGRYTAGYDANGKAITKNVLGKTQAEVKDKLRAAIEDSKKLDPVKAGSYTLEQWLKLWYSVYVEPQVRYSTREFYHNAIDHHIIPKLGSVKLEKLTMLQIQQFYNELLKSGRVQKKNHPELKEHGLSPRMVQCVHVVLNKALEHAVEEKLILMNPAKKCKIPKNTYKEMNILPEALIGPYLSAAKAHGILAPMYLELTTGLRRGELLALRWEDLDVQNRTLSINKSVARQDGKLVISTPKTPNSIRTVLLPTDTVISSMIAGLAGAFFAHYISYIDSTYFTSTASQNICVMVILGGLGSLPGTFLGAIVLTLLPELLRGLSEYRMLIYGVIMVVVVLFMPSGLMGKYNFRQLKESWLLKKHEQTERREKNG